LNFFSAWQQSERVSVRLAARGSALEPQQPTSHDARYAVSSYHTHPMYSPTYSPQQQQLQPLPLQLVVPEVTQTHLESASRLSSSSTTASSKRPLQEDESTLASKPKRTKAKSKPATPGSTSVSGALSGFFYITLQHLVIHAWEGVISLVESHCGHILGHFNFLPLYPHSPCLNIPYFFYV
jgi:hypothetical protein